MQPDTTQSLYSRMSANSGDLKGLVNAVGTELGLPDGQMYQIGMIESGLRPNVGTKGRSTAKGLYQFTSGTWKEQLTKYGAQYGIPEGTSPNDPVANSILGAVYIKSNTENYREIYGKDPELVDTYMGHFLGNKGRKDFLDAMASNPTAPAFQFVGKRSASANKEVFFKKDGTPRSLNEVHQMFANKLGAESDAAANDKTIASIRSQMADKEFLTGILNSEREASKPTESGLGLPTDGSKSTSFVDTLADYGLQAPAVEEERSFLDEAWEASKAELRLSPAGQFVSEVSLSAQRTLGMDVDWDPAAAQVAAAFGDMSPAEMLQFKLGQEYTIAPELMEKILGAGLDEKWTPYLNTAVTHEDLLQKVQLATEMAKAAETRDKASLAAGLTGGVAGALGDPLTYAGGAALKAGSIGTRMFLAGTEAAVGNVASELLLEGKTKGAIEANIGAAALGGFVAGAALRGMGDAFTNWGATTRMRARQEAIDANHPEDITSRFDVEVPEGKTYAELDGEAGAVVDEYGNTHSATSPANPKNIEDNITEEIRANKGVPIGTLAYDLLRSESNEARGIAANLVRSPTGIQGGGSGKAGSTAEDVLSRVEGQDNLWYTEARKMRDEAYTTQMWKFADNRVAREQMERQVVQAIESGDMSGLSAGQRAYADKLVELMVRKHDEGTNPSRFGHEDAPAVFSSTRDPNGYFPQVFEEGKVNAAKARFGGEEGWEGLQEAIKSNWKAQLSADHRGVRAKFKEMFADTVAERKAAAEEDIKALVAAKEGKAEGLDESAVAREENYKKSVEQAEKAAKLKETREAKRAKLDEKLAYFNERITAYEEKLRKAAKDTTKMKYKDMIEGYKLRVENLKVDMRDMDALIIKSEKNTARLNERAERRSNKSDMANLEKELMDARFAEAYKAADEDQILEDLIEEYIEKKSYGISRNGDFTHAAGLEDANLNDSLVGIENNNFTQERNIFDSGFENVAADGDMFAINDLRHFDTMNVALMYNKRMNGDVAIHASTGKTTKDLKDSIVALPEGKDRHNLDQLVRVITGRSRNAEPSKAFGVMLRGLQDVSFASNNAQMWINNLTEVSGWATNRLMFMARNGVAGMNQLFNPQTKFTKADMKSFRDGLFGKELQDALSPSYINVWDSLIRQGSGKRVAAVAAAVRVGGASLATSRANIYTRMLNGTQEALVGLARSGTLADITNEAFGGVKINPATLRNASVTPDQYRGILEMLRENVKVVDGEFKPDVAAIRKDRRTNDLWRLADYIASDSVMRTGKVGFNYTSTPNAMMNLALQFKSFMLKGLNARTVRMFHESFQGKSIDNAMRVLVSTGITGSIWAMQSHYRSLGIPEEDREEYLNKMLDPSMWVYQSLSRQPELGPLLGAVNLALTPTGQDIFKAGRSTVDPRSVVQYGDPLKSDALDMRTATGAIGQSVTDMFPAARTMTAPVVIGSGAVGAATADYGYQQDMQLRAFFEGLGSLAPNAPEVQWLINQMAEQAGASGREMR